MVPIQQPGSVIVANVMRVPRGSCNAVWELLQKVKPVRRKSIMMRMQILWRGHLKDIQKNLDTMFGSCHVANIEVIGGTALSSQLTFNLLEHDQPDRPVAKHY